MSATVESVLVWQSVEGARGFSGEDLHWLGHRRLGPLLGRRLGEAAPAVRHDRGDLAALLRRCAGEGAPGAVVLPTFRDQLRASLDAVEALARAAPSLSVLLSGWGTDPDYLDAIGRPLAHPRLALARGEPEEALVDALELLARSPEGWPAAELEALGLALPDGAGDWLSRGRFRQVADLGSLPSVYETGELEPAELGGAALIEVARGCRHRCRFCLSSNFDPPGVRPLPTEAIVAELGQALRRGARHLALLCSALNYDVEVLEAIAQALSGRPEAPTIESTIHLSSLDPRRLAAIERLRWRRMIVGLQTVTPEAAALMGRAVDPPRFRAAVERVARFHEPVVELILGLPGDTLRGFLRTLRFALDLPAHVEVYHLRLDPGSRFFADRASLGIEADFSRMGRVRATGTFPANDLERARQALELLGRRPWRARARSLGLDFRRLAAAGPQG